MGRLEEGIPPIPRERLGKEFKVTKDTAKVLYFELCCDLNFIDGDLEKFFYSSQMMSLFLGIMSILNIWIIN